MSRMSWPMITAVVVMAVMALLLISGPWSPRFVEKVRYGRRRPTATAGTRHND